MAQSWGGMSSTISVNSLNDYIRHQAQELQSFSQLANAPTGAAIGRGKGDTVQYTYSQNLSTTGGALSENEEIPTGTVPTIKNTYTLTEYGNGYTYSNKLAVFAQIDVEDTFIKALVDDMQKAMNTAAYTEFNATHWKAVMHSTTPEFVTNNTPTVTVNQDISFNGLRYIVKKAMKNLIPFYDGERYVYVTGPESMDALRYDDRARDVRYDSGRAALNGECGDMVQCRLVVDNHKIAKINATEYDSGFLVGADAVISEFASAPEILAADQDLGRSCKVAWYFIAAWKKILSQSVHAKEHVIKVTSA